MLFIPFEHILDVFFGIDTILKPYRTASILVIGTYLIKVFFKGGGQINYRDDFPFYLIFIYGLLISLIQMTQGRFSMRYFNNDTFQISLYLLTYFIMKNMSLTPAKWIRLFWCLTWGIILNSGYLFNAFFFHGDYSRQGGFMNNPNYVALSIVVAIAFIVYRISVNEQWRKKLFYAVLAVFLLYVFPVTGSRTGLFILAVLSSLIFIFASLRSKIVTLVAIAGMSFIFLSQNMDKFNVGASFVLTNRVINKQGVEDVRVPLWKGAMKAGNDVFFMGIGIGQFKNKFTKLFQTEYHKTILECVNRGAYLSTHSDYVTLLVVYGMPSLLFYLFFLGNITRKLMWEIQFAATKAAARFYQFSLMILAALVIFGIGSENFLSPIYWALLAFATVSLTIPFPTKKVI
jgi:hypothetical protein